MKKRLARIVTRKLHEPIAEGVTRNVVANISSYVGLQQAVLNGGGIGLHEPNIKGSPRDWLGCATAYRVF